MQLPDDSDQPITDWARCVCKFWSNKEESDCAKSKTDNTDPKRTKLCRNHPRLTTENPNDYKRLRSNVEDPKYEIIQPWSLPILRGINRSPLPRYTPPTLSTSHRRPLTHSHAWLSGDGPIKEKRSKSTWKSSATEHWYCSRGEHQHSPHGRYRDASPHKI